MTKQVCLIHTLSGVVDMFNSLCQEILPQAKVCNIADDTLIQGLLAAGGLTPAIYRRVGEHVVAAEANGADVIQLTCSSISPCVDEAKNLVRVPVLKIDEPMVEQAVNNHEKIGIIATAPTTLKPTTDLVNEKATALSRSIKIESVLCEGAYDAFLAGNTAEHDKIVRRYLSGLIKKVDVILLAQASMTRVVDTLDDEEKSIPIFSSPRPAMERLANVLKTGT